MLTQSNAAAARSGNCLASLLPKPQKPNPKTLVSEPETPIPTPENHVFTWRCGRSERDSIRVNSAHDPAITSFLQVNTLFSGVGCIWFSGVGSARSSVRCRVSSECMIFRCRVSSERDSIHVNSAHDPAITSFLQVHTRFANIYMISRCRVWVNT